MLEESAHANKLLELIYDTWALASETDPLLEESAHAFLYLSIVDLTLRIHVIISIKKKQVSSQRAFE